MSKNLETIVFEPRRFEKQLKAFVALLKSKADLSEAADIQPFFKKSKQLSVYLGTFSPDIGPATELAFEFPFFGDHTADLLLGRTASSKNRQAEATRNGALALNTASAN